jgi:hypothetical protein
VTRDMHPPSRVFACTVFGPCPELLTSWQISGKFANYLASPAEKSFSVFLKGWQLRKRTIWPKSEFSPQRTMDRTDKIRSNNVRSSGVSIGQDWPWMLHAIHAIHRRRPDRGGTIGVAISRPPTR